MLGITKKDLLFFIVFWAIVAVSYYFIFNDEYSSQPNQYKFLVDALIPASAVLAVPFIQGLIKYLRSK